MGGDVVSFALIEALAAGDPEWMRTAPEVTKTISNIDAMQQTLGGTGIWLPIGVLSLVLLKLAPALGDMLRSEHALSIERRRRRDEAGGSDAGAHGEGR